MKSTITLRNVYDGETLNPLSLHTQFFSGGEPHVVVNPAEISCNYLWIDARICDAEGFITLCAVADAVYACNPAKVGLFIPYFPGGRQDRAFPNGAFTLRVYAGLINNLGFDAVVTVDDHSDVTAALLNNHTNISQKMVLASHFPTLVAPPYDGIIIPDAGAQKKAYDVADALNISHIVQAGKRRDVKTGKLSGFTCDPFPSGHYLIPDDCCDKGGTFIGLAEHIRATWDMYKKGSPYELSLYVSHGIFSAGLDELLKYFRRIITTDSFQQSDRVTTIPLSGLAAGYMRALIGS